MTGMSTPSTRDFTTERSAAPCRRRRADGWRACKAMKAAPDVWRLLASVSVDDTGLQRRSLADTGTDSECERDETVYAYQNAGYSGRFMFCAPMFWTRGQSFFPSKYAPKCSSRAMSCGQPRFRSASLRKGNASEKMYVCAVTSPHTDTIAEVHNRLCAADDHFLIISAHLDYYRSGGGRTA